MPELPEVETVRAGLAELLPGLEIKSVESDWEKSFPNAKSDTDRFLIGAKIVQIRRRGKALIIDLSSDYSLVIHLKMTGQLVFRSDSAVFGAGHPSSSLTGKLPDKSTRVIFSLEGAKLFFNDQRKFGWAKLIPTIEIDHMDFFKKLGPEPLAHGFTAKDFRGRIRKRPGSKIKPALMDQTVIAGVGNIYADEALWGAKIHPEERVRNVSDAKLNKLYEELIYVLKLAIEKGGSTDKNYVDAKGKKGSYLKFARVFRRENLPCPRCGNTIIKTRVGGRGTHLCPHCQKL
jgi:formamidopyrimidine-DNA glycosylase